MKNSTGCILGGQMAPKSGFWPWKEVFGGDADGSMDSNESTCGQRQLKESIVGCLLVSPEKKCQFINVYPNSVTKYVCART